MKPGIWSAGGVNASLLLGDFQLDMLYGHLFSRNRASILDAMNQAVSRLYAYECQELDADEDGNAVA